LIIYLLSQSSGRAEVGKDDVSAEGKKGFLESIEISDPPGDMKLFNEMAQKLTILSDSSIFIGTG